MEFYQFFIPSVDKNWHFTTHPLPPHLHHTLMNEHWHWMNPAPSPFHVNIVYGCSQTQMGIWLHFWLHWKRQCNENCIRNCSQRLGPILCYWSGCSWQRNLHKVNKIKIKNRINTVRFGLQSGTLFIFFGAGLYSRFCHFLKIRAHIFGIVFESEL